MLPLEAPERSARRRMVSCARPRSTSSCSAASRTASGAWTRGRAIGVLLCRRAVGAFTLMERPLHYDAGVPNRELQPSAAATADGARPVVEQLYPGASARPMRHGRQGLLWDPVTQMPPAAREQLRQRIVPVATAAFDGTTGDYWAQHWSDEQLDRLDVLHVAVDETGAPVGWVSGRRADWGGRRVFYAASAGVAPDIQGGGVSAALWRRVVEGELRRALLWPLFVVLRTGNPL